MTNKVESESDEPKIAALMRTLDANTLAPDAAVLEALRIQAAAKFEEAASVARDSVGRPYQAVPTGT